MERQRVGVDRILVDGMELTHLPTGTAAPRGRPPALVGRGR
jgi:hypothetical protein